MRMSRVMKYLMEELEISEEKALKMQDKIFFLANADNGENMLRFYLLDKLADKEGDSKLADLYESYEERALLDSGELEQETIRDFYGKEVLSED